MGETGTELWLPSPTHNKQVEESGMASVLSPLPIGREQPGPHPAHSVAGCLEENPANASVPPFFPNKPLVWREPGFLLGRSSGAAWLAPTLPMPACFAWEFLPFGCLAGPPGMIRRLARVAGGKLVGTVRTFSKAKQSSCQEILPGRIGGGGDDGPGLQRQPQ